MIRKTAIARSIALAFGMAAVGVWVAPAAYAQSNTTGTIFGSVDSAAGAEVAIENTGTGFKRTVKPDANGRYSFASIPTGVYTVSLLRNGAVVSSQADVEVRISQGSEVNLGAASQTIRITGSRVSRIDTSSATSATVFTARDLERIPVASNVGAIIQLAPNTTKGDSRYGGAGAPSFGGSSASENAYYINGFPVTTLLTQVGFSQLPFKAIGEANVLTGGYGAEFGRSTGGVVNIITKRGTNEWEVGGQVEFEPRKLRAKERDMYYAPTGVTGGTPATLFDNKYRLYNGLNEDQRTTYGVYAGGPIIKDKLFVFGAFEQIKRERESVRTANASALYANSAAANSTSFEERDVSIPRYLLKLDWAITDNHSMEYTRISDKVKDDRKYFGFNYATLQRTNVQNGGASYVNWGPTPVAAQQGATVDILKYTGYLTQDLTLTALIGRTETLHTLSPTGYNAAIPQISFSNGAAPGINYVNNQGFTGNILADGAFDRNKGARIDVEYKLAAAHKLRAGIDYNKISTYSGQSTAGGVLYTYLKTATPGTAPDTQTQAPNSVAGNVLGAQGYYVQRSVSSTGARPSVIQTAEYIEDQWQVTRDIGLTLGLRNEGFDNRNGDDQSYIKLSKQIAPRLAAVWDLKGDATSVLKATLGRYHVPVPTNAAIRAAGSSLNAQQNFVYTNVDANGAPTGTTAISPFYSPNNELGQAKDPKSVAAENMKGNYQDELTFGIEQSVARGWNASAKFTYRTLRTAIDDHCDDRPFLAWAARNGVNASGFGYNCALFNPGIANTFNLDLDGDGKAEHIYLSAADLGIPKVKRTYLALDFALEHPFDGKWIGKVTYTYSKNKGNTEGQTLSDIGQADVSTTQAFDYPEFSTNAYGKLPNNRTHQLKAFGAYQVVQEFAVGGAFVYASGRPRNCIGSVPTATSSTPYVQGGPVFNYSNYGSAYFFCNGQPSPRGSQGTLPAEFTTDLNFQYTPAFVPGLKLKADVFNVFNRQAAEVIEERYNTTAGGLRNTYGAVQSYSLPRSVKFTVAYDKKF